MLVAPLRTRRALKLRLFAVGRLWLSFLQSLTSLSLNCCPLTCVLFTAVREGEFFQIFGASFEPEKRTPSGLVGVPYRWWIADGCLIKLQPIGSLPGAVVPFRSVPFSFLFVVFARCWWEEKMGAFSPLPERGVWSPVLHFHLRFALAVDKGKHFSHPKCLVWGKFWAGFVPTA